MLTISLDFDGTVTRDPQHWRRWLALARVDGHRVITVTSRRDTAQSRAEIREVLGEDHEIVFAYDQPKKMAAIEAGHDVDIFIDDQPHMIGQGGESTRVVGLFENELRHAWAVLKDAMTMGSHPALHALERRLETVLGE